MEKNSFISNRAQINFIFTSQVAAIQIFKRWGTGGQGFLAEHPNTDIPTALQEPCVGLFSQFWVGNFSSEQHNHKGQG